MAKKFTLTGRAGTSLRGQPFTHRWQAKAVGQWAKVARQLWELPLKNSEARSIHQIPNMKNQCQDQPIT